MGFDAACSPESRENMVQRACYLCVAFPSQSESKDNHSVIPANIPESLCSSNTRAILDVRSRQQPKIGEERQSLEERTLSIPDFSSKQPGAINYAPAAVKFVQYFSLTTRSQATPRKPCIAESPLLLIDPKKEETGSNLQSDLQGLIQHALVVNNFPR